MSSDSNTQVIELDGGREVRLQVTEDGMVFRIDVYIDGQLRDTNLTPNMTVEEAQQIYTKGQSTWNNS